MTPSEALELMHAPRPDLECAASYLQVLREHRREWSRAQEAAARSVPGQREHAERLRELLAHAPAPLLRHMVGESFELVGDLETSLAEILRAVADTPRWDPMLVAWGYNGVAGLLHGLGRKSEAAELLSRLWRLEPFYPGARATANTLGLAPPAATELEGNPDSLRLALAHAIYEDNRAPGVRATAMAVSLVWSRDHVAAASMAELAQKLPGVDVAWPRAVAEHARARATSDPGSLPPLPKGGPALRAKAVKRALASKDLGLLEIAALDPNVEVMLAAWQALIALGHRRDELVGLLRELVVASSAPNEKTMLAAQVEELLSALPLDSAPTGAALVARAIEAIRSGAACSLPSGPSPSTASGLPPSLVTWLDFGRLDESEPRPVLELVRRAHGGTFDRLPARLAKCPALPLFVPESAGERFELLLLGHADEAGETPVLAFDVSDGASVEISAPSFAAWLAVDVGVAGPGTHAEAASARAEAVFGKKKRLLF